MSNFTRVCKFFALIAALASALAAQTTTVTGTPKVATGDAVSGTITIAPVFSASTGTPERIVTAPVTVGFSGGTLSIALLPTDTMTPSVQKYRVTYNVPMQTVNGHRVDGASYGPCYWTVPSSPSTVDVGQIESCSSTVVAPLQKIDPSQINQGGAILGQGLCWNGSVFAPGFCVGGYSLDLMQPSASDTGKLQKVEDKLSYSISAVSCSTDQGTASVNLDVRSTPNVAGTNVLGSPVTCTAAANTVLFVSSAVSVPSGYAVALDILSVSGSPGVVRVHVSR